MEVWAFAFFSSYFTPICNMCYRDEVNRLFKLYVLMYRYFFGASGAIYFERHVRIFTTWGISVVLICDELLNWGFLHSYYFTVPLLHTCFVVHLSKLIIWLLIYFDLLLLKIMQALVEHYSTKGWLQRVEQCVLHMDMLSLDFNQVLLHVLYPSWMFWLIRQKCKGDCP